MLTCQRYLTFNLVSSKISPDLDPSDGTPPTGAGAVHALERESWQLQYRFFHTGFRFPRNPTCVGLCGRPTALTPRRRRHMCRCTLAT